MDTIFVAKLFYPDVILSIFMTVNLVLTVGLP
jgi:hypothetical protein